MSGQTHFWNMKPLENKFVRRLVGSRLPAENLEKKLTHELQGWVFDEQCKKKERMHHIKNMTKIEGAESESESNHAHPIDHCQC